MISTIFAMGLLGISVPAVTSQPVSSQCLSIPGVPQFDPLKYIGLWYEQARYFDSLVEGTKCVTSNYTLNNNIITLRNSGINATTKEIVALSADFRTPDPSDPSKFKIKFPTLPRIPEANYWVAATDYGNYSIAYACNNVKNFIRTRVWLKTRVRNPSKAIIDLALSQAISRNIDTSRFVWIDQDNCEN